jgi:hypothetical protein
MTNLRRAAWIGTCCLLALLLGSVPARSQSSLADFAGFYTVVDNDTGAESLMRLEYLPGTHSGFMVATVFSNNGAYRVFAGPIFVQGGIPIATAYLSAAKAPYQVLKRPRRAFENPERSFNQRDQCQITLLYSEPLALDYTCSNPNQHSSGRLTRLRK